MPIWTPGGVTPPKYVPKTGQTTSYQAGDDGALQKGDPVTPRFVDNTNNTIDDKATGLQWVKDHAVLGTVGGKNFAAGMSWSNALLAVAALNAANYAGHNDWRLPNVKELMSIVEYGSVSPAINGTFFPNTVSDGYWTGTTYAGYTDGAWVVYFNDGVVSSDDKNVGYYVRPVRQY
jgi:hypothetical protein